MAERLGLEVGWVPGDWRHGVDPDKVAAVLRADPSIAAVTVVHNETSTGVTSRVGAVREAIDAAGSDALLLVDMAILSAVIARERTGRGQRIDT